MRLLSIGVPSGKIKMTLWEGTDEQQAFPIIAVNSQKPYVKAYGRRYELIEEEIKALRQLQKLYRRPNGDTERKKEKKHDGRDPETGRKMNDEQIY